MKLYYVNPADTTDISLCVDERGNSEVPLRRTTLPDGRVVERFDGAVPAWDVYEGVEDTTPIPPYNRVSGVTTAFVGVVNDPAARVQETWVFVQFSLDELYAEKWNELEGHAGSVLFSSFQMEGIGGTDFWVEASQVQRFAYGDIDRYYQWNIDGIWRDVPVYLVRVDNGNRIRSKIAQNEYATLAESLGRFTQNVLYARDETIDEMERLFDLPDWQALADLDVVTYADGTSNPWPASSDTAFGPTRP